MRASEAIGRSIVRVVLAAVLASQIGGCARSGATASLPQSPSAMVYEIRGGRWLIGDHFEARTLYMSGGRFVSPPGRAADSILDVESRYIVPPFAEGHNHWLEPSGIQAYIQAYLRDGVFYVKDQANAPFIRAQIDSALNQPTSVDFVSANQGWTGPGGHPLQIARQFVALGVFPKTWADSGLDPNVLMMVRDSSDIARHWAVFMAGHPSFTKVFLLNSEEFDRRANDDAFQFRRGINPSLVKEIVRRSHAAGLRVSAHIYTAGDFRAAVKGGVDDIAHFPGTGIPTEPDMPLSAFAITDADARDAAARGITVTTTLSWLGEIDDSAKRARVLREVIQPNLMLLRKHGIHLLIGSDQFRSTSAPEADILVKLGLFTPMQLLHAWCVETPRAIFPKRRLGEFTPGAEASFLALLGNPLEDFANAHRIAMRVKQGHVLQLQNPPPPFPPLR